METANSFIVKTEKIKLECGKEVELTTPTLGWWYDFLIPHIALYQSAQVLSRQDQAKIIAEVKANKLTPEMLAKMPSPILNVMLDVVAYYAKESADWCKQNMSINDFLAVINAFFKLIDVKRMLDFFESISLQVPLQAGMALIKAV